MDFKQRALLRRDVVVAVTAGGHPDAVAKEFGVSRASVYNWVKAYRIQGMRGLAKESGDRRFALPNKSGYETDDAVRRFMRDKPKFSADKLSAHWGNFGIVVSPRTLRSIFNRLGLNTKKQRLVKGIKPDENYMLNDEFLAILEKIIAPLESELSGRKPGDVLVQDRIKLPVKTGCNETCFVELIVDTFASMRRIYAVIGPATDQLSLDALQWVERIYQTDGFKIHKVCTPRKRQYAGALGAVAYPCFFEKNLQYVHEIRKTGERTIDSRIEATWIVLKNQWLPGLRDRLGTKILTIRSIDDDLKMWLMYLKNKKRSITYGK